MVKFDDLINNNMFKCLLLVIIGYCVAKMFYNSCNCSNGVRNGFSVGAGVCPDGTCELPEPDQDFCYEKVIIDSISKEPSCYNTEHPPALVKSSHSCNERDGIEILRDIPALPGYQGKENWRRCLRIDSRNDPRTYKCDPDSKKCKVTNVDDPDGVRKTQCQQYCDVTMAACMTKNEFGTEYEVEGIKGFKCRELTLAEKKDYIVNHTVTNISPGKQVYIGPDALKECQENSCGFNCSFNGINPDCEPNTESNVGYKDHGTCMSKCRIVYTCDKGDDECYGCQPHPLTEVKGKEHRDQPGECEKELCDKTWTCDRDIGQCKCVEPKAGEHSTQEICQINCKAKNMYEYRCPLDDVEYKMGGSQPGCAEFLCDAAGCGPYGFDSNAISPGGRAMLEENCNSGLLSGSGINDDDKKALFNVNGKRENDETCNLECSTDPNHFQWGNCTNIANQCRKEGTILKDYNPTGIFSGDNCDISNKLCTNQDDITDCNVSCTISEPSASGCIVDIGKSKCYYDMTYKDVYGRSCPSRTHQISCVGLDKQSDLWNSPQNASDCDLFGSLEDLKSQLEKLDTQVGTNASNIDDLQGRVGTLDRKFNELDAKLNDLSNSLTRETKHLQSQVDLLNGTLDTLRTNYAGLIVKIGELKSGINANQQDIEDLGRTYNALSDRVEALESNVSGVKDDVSDVKGRVGGLETNVSGLQGEINSESGRVDTLYTNVSGLQSSIGGLSGRVGGLETNVSGLSHLMHDFESGLYDKVGKLNHNVANNTRILAGYHRRIFTIKTSINSFIETVNVYLPQHHRINYI